MEAEELVKQWTDETLPKFPPSEFNIGDVVRRVDADEDEGPQVIVGIRLRYYRYMRQHVWYYETADHYHSPSVTMQWSDADDFEKYEVKTEDEKHLTTGEETGIVPVTECWNCHQVRVDDSHECPFCEADSIPF